MFYTLPDVGTSSTLQHELLSRPTHTRREKAFTLRRKREPAHYNTTLQHELPSTP